MSSWVVSHAKGQSGSETHAPNHITLWLRKATAPLGKEKRQALEPVFYIVLVAVLGSAGD